MNALVFFGEASNVDTEESIANAIDPSTLFGNAASDEWVSRGTDRSGEVLLAEDTELGRCVALKIPFG
jgi:hypothetical protein